MDCKEQQLKALILQKSLNKYPIFKAKRLQIQNIGNSNKKWAFGQKKYEIVDLLGKGRTSFVYKARLVDDKSQFVAIKVLINQYLKFEKRSAEKEITILNQLSHDNIVKILSYGDDGTINSEYDTAENLVYLIMEYIPNGSLYNIIHDVGKDGKYGNEDSGRYLFLQMIQFLDYIQSKKVAHLDMKVENILVDDDLTLKVGDFGFSTHHDVYKLETKVGTENYIAPEIQNGKTFDGFAADIFSTGVVLFTLVNRKFPFFKATQTDKYYKMIHDGHLKEYWSLILKGDKNLSVEFKDLCERMFEEDPQKRITLDGLKKHPWVTQEFSKENVRNNILVNTHRPRVLSFETAESDTDMIFQEEVVLEGVSDSKLTDMEINTLCGMHKRHLNIIQWEVQEDALTLNTQISKRWSSFKEETRRSIRKIKSSKI